MFANGPIKHLRYEIQEQQREDIRKAPQDDMGHLGTVRYLNKIQENYYWPNLTYYVETYCPCPKNPLPLKERLSNSHIERVAMDIVGRLNPQIQNTFQILGIIKTRTIAYCPQYYGLVKRVDKTFLNMLAKASIESIDELDKMLKLYSSHIIPRLVIPPDFLHLK
ncbi:hypothetical protein RF11_09040 [Thelohanellus kitauei]|uniref:Integrase zinc-binding domain-containing protein n=1 Tax=Thelohanellus kitauei TaxID=669202 RepID=A0A0C2MTR1_THEKT|nr:hypothetical protein RF11_09040 [Thelohanellus kitauei]